MKVKELLKSTAVRTFIRILINKNGVVSTLGTFSIGDDDTKKVDDYEVRAVEPVSRLEMNVYVYPDTTRRTISTSLSLFTILNLMDLKESIYIILDDNVVYNGRVDNLLVDNNGSASKFCGYIVTLIETSSDNRIMIYINKEE